ncbi:Peptidase M19, renal dipeptidase [Niveomyces insectorum RCEF 264]|uniref:Dipeptidase n=1 Tax=Niveomyces insectorum RCEF 264 TaxID=1081102 RepID=A0A167W7N0_9HYPO|nr:Peptidase M19, renal dipeptidase [Niveomyces insectorum RCEF 264]
MSAMDEALEVLQSVPLIGELPSTRLCAEVRLPGWAGWLTLTYIDGHNDWPHLIRGFYDNKLDGRFGPGNDLVGHVDLKRLRRGKSGGAFWSVYVDCPTSDDYNDDSAHFEILRDTMQQIDLVHRLVHLYKDDMGLVHSASDIMRLFNEGKFVSLIGVEGLHQIANSPSVLRLYHRLGVRYVTLAHSKNNLYADSATAAAPAHEGLSAKGKEMVREMNRIGIAAIVGHPRNVPDSVLEMLRVNQGIIMVSFIPPLTAVDAAESNLDRLVDHIIHVGTLIGYDHVGLGSDFDGMFSAVKGIDDVSHYPSLVAKMLERGIGRADVQKILGLNVIRVLEQVERTSAACYDELPVMGEEVKQLWNDGFRAAVKQVYPHAEQDLPR